MSSLSFHYFRPSIAYISSQSGQCYRWFPPFRPHNNTFRTQCSTTQRFPLSATVLYVGSAVAAHLQTAATPLAYKCEAAMGENTDGRKLDALSASLLTARRNADLLLTSASQSTPIRCARCPCDRAAPLSRSSLSQLLRTPQFVPNKTPR